MTINSINETNTSSQISEATPLLNNPSAAQLKENATDVTKDISNEAKPMTSVQEMPKTPKASGLKGAILALFEKIKNFFHRAPKQTANQNQVQVAGLQDELKEVQEQLQQALDEKQRLSAENDRLKSNFPASAFQDTSAVPVEDLNALKQQLAEMQQKLAEYTAGEAQKPARNLIQELDSAPSTFIESDLLSLLRNELPKQEISATDSVPVPPPAPGGVPPPPPPPPVLVSGRGATKISTLKALKSGPNFQDVISQCRGFCEKGYQIGEITVYDKKSFNAEIQKLNEGIRERRANNEQNLTQIGKLQKDIRTEVDKLLSDIEESPDLSAKELSDLKQRYNSAPELLLKDADQLKSLKLMDDAQYKRLGNIRAEVDTNKEVLRKKLEAYLNEGKAIDKREKEISAFKLPLPDTRKVPYLNEVLQLLTLEQKLEGNPEERQQIRNLLSSDLSKDVQETLNKNSEKLTQLESQIKAKENELQREIEDLRKNSNYKNAIAIYDKKGMQGMLLELRGQDKKIFERLNGLTNEIRKLEQEKGSLSVSEQSILKKAITQANIALRQA